MGHGQLNVGFIGLGNMGAPMCRRLVKAGYRVSAFDINPIALTGVVGDGAIAAASARQCVESADVVVTSLPRPDHVELVMDGPDGALSAMKSGSIWVDLTTNRVEVIERLAASAPQGVAVVDCPVTGAVDGARNGRLTLFIGGEKFDVERVGPLLANLGRVIHCGRRCWTVVKLVTNQLWFIGAAAIGEGFAVGVANGVELGTLWQAILASVGDS
ncbi:MAG: NAD(P)-dependent oxidoreductase, partial [Actinobacteria bacterium]|nr:NAD(P)-dependent oxidoreductase [Actinomycetota bacterium]